MDGKKSELPIDIFTKYLVASAKADFNNDHVSRMGAYFWGKINGLEEATSILKVEMAIDDDFDRIFPIVSKLIAERIALAKRQDEMLETLDNVGDEDSFRAMLRGTVAAYNEVLNLLPLLKLLAKKG